MSDIRSVSKVEHSPPQQQQQQSKKRQKILSVEKRDRTNDDSDRKQPSSSDNRRGNENTVPNDPNLPELNDDPRAGGPMHVRRGKGMNTESFDPKSTLVRPSMRVLVGKKQKTYGRPLKHDDVVMVPDLFCDSDDWNIYYKLVEEMRAMQAEGKKGSEWLSWHEGSHLISKGPEGSPTFQSILDRLCEYFNVKPGTMGTRFNWYRNSKDVSCPYIPSYT